MWGNLVLTSSVWRIGKKINFFIVLKINREMIKIL
jgi:hypothetical protein